MAGRQRSFRLTDAAMAGLDRLATRHHVTQTALLEALGTLSRHRDPTLAEIIDEARRLDRERRSRR